MIRLENVTKDYGGFEAVKGLSLHIKEGELFGFLGPNGAGKTTTIKMLTGLLRATAGKVLLGGIDIAQDPVGAKKIIGLVPDRPYFYGKLRGREYLEFIGDVYEVPDAKQKAGIVRLLGEFRLTDWGDELIESYSQGMRQRLAFCAALLHKPSILIVDEPVVGLDPEGIVFMKKVLKRHCKEGGTVFISSHSLDVVESVCTRIGIIHYGTLRFEGAVSEIKARQKSPELVDAFLALTTGEAGGGDGHEQ